MACESEGSDYAVVRKRLQALPTSIKREVVAEASSYPVYRVTVGPHISRPLIWINAGTHGDEPATVETALTFLESGIAENFPNTRIIVTPCLNPYGYVNGKRENEAGIDVNWAFKLDIPEIALVKQMTGEERYEAVIDLHEDWESPGFYLYEQCRSGQKLGHRISDLVAEVCPVNNSPQIEGEIADRGVIYPDLEALKRRDGDGVPVEIFKRATDHHVTSESPSEKPIPVRVDAHMVAIRVFLEAYGE